MIKSINDPWKILKVVPQNKNQNWKSVFLTLRGNFWVLNFSVKSKNDLWTISGNFAFGPIKIWTLLVGQKVDYFLYCQKSVFFFTLRGLFWVLFLSFENLGQNQKWSLDNFGQFFFWAHWNLDFPCGSKSGLLFFSTVWLRRRRETFLLVNRYIQFKIWLHSTSWLTPQMIWFWIKNWPF